MISNKTCVYGITSARFHGNPVTGPGTFSAWTAGSVAARALPIVSHLALGLGDARKVTLLVPSWCFRSKSYQSLFFYFNKSRGIISYEESIRRASPFEIDARSFVIDSIDVLVLQVTECLELHRVVQCGSGDGSIFTARYAKRCVRTDFVHF